MTQTGALSSASRRLVRRLTVDVEFHHVDMMQVVHNSQYFRWFERGRLALLEEVFPLTWALAQKIATPVVSNRAEYLWPAAYGETLVVTTVHHKAQAYEGRFAFAHSISNARTKRELCVGETIVTVLDLGTKRLVKELPTEVWARYQALT